MATKTEILDKITEVLRKELMFDGEIDVNAPIKNLGLDSIQLMQMFVYLEETFSFEFSDDAVFDRVRDSDINQFIEMIHASIHPVATGHTGA
jgi:acyl carrier protein